MPAATYNPPKVLFFHESSGTQDVPHALRQHARQYVDTSPPSSSPSSTVTTIIIVAVIFFALVVLLALARKSMGSHPVTPRRPVAQAPQGPHRGPVIAEVLAARQDSATITAQRPMQSPSAEVVQVQSQTVIVHQDGGRAPTVPEDEPVELPPPYTSMLAV